MPAFQNSVSATEAGSMYSALTSFSVLACAVLGTRLGAKMKLCPLNPFLCTSTYVFFLSLLLFYFFIVVQVQFSAFSPHPSSTPSPPHLSPISTLLLHYCPCVLYNCSYKPFTLFPWNSLPSPLRSLSAFSQFQCLWLYFACLFVLLIRFLLKVRSYGISLSPPGLFHLA